MILQKTMAYLTITTLFQKNESDLSASEAHGLATGLLCIENQIEPGYWLTELFDNSITLTDDDKTILISLFEQTRTLLKDDDNSFSFDLFLPSDEAPLGEQLEAISSWCEGFLFGIGYTRSSSSWPGETKEIMKDMVEFTKIDTHVDDDISEEEIDEQLTSLMEIQHYLKTAVLIMRDQLATEINEQKH